MDIIALFLGIILGALATALVMYVYAGKRTQADAATIATLQAELEAGKQFLSRWDAQTQQRQDFERLAATVLEQNSQRLTTTNEAQLDLLLRPLRERITDFERTLLNTYQSEAQERFHLKKEIELLSQTSLRVGADAQNLARALKGDSKLRGNWGEMVLTRILESSGLREGEEFITQGQQMTLQTADGKRQMPDVIVRLPERKHIVVDAKVSLVGYERYVAATDETARNQALKEHTESVLNHIKELSAKHYQGLTGLNSPDFVLLFMPIEGAFSTAVMARPELLAFAWERKIMPVSPTTLLATLRTVSSVWKTERQHGNSQEIARQGGLLYDKFAEFVLDMDKLGKQIQAVGSTYDEALKRLKDGRENLMVQAKRLEEMGVKTKKEL